MEEAVESAVDIEEASELYNFFFDDVSIESEDVGNEDGICGSVVCVVLSSDGVAKGVYGP